jgi:hypothetical protein
MHDQGNPETGSMPQPHVAVAAMAKAGWVDRNGVMARVLAYVAKARRRSAVESDFKALEVLGDSQAGRMREVARTARGFMEASIETVEDMEAGDGANMRLSDFYQMAEDVGTTDDIGTPAERELLRELVEIVRENNASGVVTVHAMPITDALAADVQAGVDLAFSTPRAKAKPRQGKAAAQKMNEQMDRGFPESFAQWQAEADAIDASSTRQAEVRQRVLQQDGLSPGEEVWFRRAVARATSDAFASGSEADIDEALQLAFQRQAAGARAARELAARRLDLSTPQGRRELLLSYAMEMPSSLEKQYRKADRAGKAKITRQWNKRVTDMRRRLKDKFGVDIGDPRLGEVFATPRQVGALMDEIASVRGDFHLGRLLGYYVAGNLLTAGSIAANVTGYPLMAGVQTLRGISGALTKTLTGKVGNERLASWGGIEAAMAGGVRGITRGIRNGAVAYWTGIPQAERMARPVMGTYEELDRSTAPIKNPLLRALLAPAMEANRFLDEVAWTVAYEGAVAAAATERAHATGGSAQALQAQPDAEMIEQASRFADRFTLRGTDNEALQKALRSLGNLRAADAQWLTDAADAVVPGMGKWSVNPLYFTMPFFNAIANLTVEGVKLSPYAMVAHLALATKRAKATVAGDDEQAAAFSRNVAYMLGGLALMALAYGGDDDEPWATGSPKLDQTRGEREVREAVEQPRTIFGVSYSRWDPAALPLAMHADLRKAITKWRAGEDATKLAVGLGEQAFSSAVQRNFLEGFTSLLRPEYDADGQKKGLVQKYGENAAEAMMPGRPLVRSYRQMTDEVKDAPGQTIPERAYGSGRDGRNLFGELRRVREDGDTMTAIGQLFAYPTPQPSPEVRGWMQEIHQAAMRVEQAGGKPTWPDYPQRTYERDGKRVRMTDAEYDAVQARAGELWLQRLRDQRDSIAEADPERKLELIGAAKGKANAQARREVLEQ